MSEQAKLAESWSYGYGIRPRVEGWERRCNDSTCSFRLACLFLFNPRRSVFSSISAKEFPSVINKRKSFLAISHEGMARLLYGCLFSDIGVERLSYQSKIISIKIIISLIIKGESETSSISEITIIILSRKFIDSFEAAAFSFTNLFFPPSRLSLLSSGTVEPFVAFPILLQQLQEKKKKKKKNSSQKILFPLRAMRDTNKEANGSKLSKRWLAQLSEKPVDCVCGRSLFAKQ